MDRSDTCYFHMGIFNCMWDPQVIPSPAAELRIGLILQFRGAQISVWGGQVPWRVTWILSGLVMSKK